MNVDKIPKSGTTPSRKTFWDSVADIVSSLTKTEGRNVSVQEHHGYGTIVNATREQTAVPTGATGACCIDGECSILSNSACTEAGGNYLGDGTTCEGVDCTQGACCVGSDCTVTTEEECTGEFQGFGTDCDPNPCVFDCGSFFDFTCVGGICDTSGETSYTSIFDLSPGFMTPAEHLSGSTGPSDFATLDWYADIILDGMGGYTVNYGGTVTGRFGGTQDFAYSFSGTCGELLNDAHHDRFCGGGSGNCSDILGCTDANTLTFFDTGGFSVSAEMS